MADVVSLRANQQDVDRFREFCKENNLSSALAFESILDIAETEIAKGKIINREKEIEEFQLHVHSINRAFISSLEINENAENRVRVEFSKQLDSQLDTIADLREKLKQAEDIKNVAIEKAEAVSMKAQDAVKNAEVERDNTIKQVADLTDKLAKLESQVDNDKEIIELLKEKSGKYENEAAAYQKAKITIEEMKNTIGELKDNIKDINNEHIVKIKEIELNHTQEIADIKSNMKEMLSKKELELANVKAEADKNYYDAQGKWNEKQQKLNEELHELKSLNKDLANEIEKLKDKLAKQEEKKEDKKKQSSDDEGEQLSLL